MEKTYRVKCKQNAGPSNHSNGCNNLHCTSKTTAKKTPKKMRIWKGNVSCRYFQPLSCRYKSLVSRRGNPPGKSIQITGIVLDLHFWIDMLDLLDWWSLSTEWKECRIPNARKIIWSNLIKIFYNHFVVTPLPQICHGWTGSNLVLQTKNECGALNAEENTRKVGPILRLPRLLRYDFTHHQNTYVQHRQYIQMYINIWYSLYTHS